jgi:trk system potassium uptake protein TrkA|tara:strand:+ start:11668 stop:13026 length:1359 start_codon:yes stop_codon:yes gene_type:complete
MNILILGAGQVGSTTAAQLAKEENNDVTVVDVDPEKLDKLASKSDLRVIEGNASYPKTLKAAGADSADMLIAVTSSDEVNMVACQIVSTLFNTQTKIARIRAAAYTDRPELFSENDIPVDFAISPEDLITDYIIEVIQHPGAFQVLDFAGGKIRMVGVKTKQQGFLVDNPIRHLHDHLGNEKVRIAAIYREGLMIAPEGDTIIRKGDEVYFIAAPEDIDHMITEFNPDQEKARNIVIAGGGRIGLRLASKLEDDNHVKLIEKSTARAKKLSEILESTIVLKGDSSDDALLKEENIDNNDVFVATTNSEEANILSAMVAKKMGSKKVMALINKDSFSGLMETDSIDIAISAEQITVSSLLSHIRKGDVVKVHSLKRGGAEALEAIAHSHEHSNVVGKMVGDINLPEGSFITAIVSSQGEIKTVHHTTFIEEDDHVVVFIDNRDTITEIETIFE